ncbi:hypothetical protein JZ751_028307 [Albula glossodonta]|uniref:Uncharacterized protein n=1 Tax=Albula glossodonta TaxID=121402 RepID=A0A8T2NEC4_9TELE|nr:hypothetical protein JZ751_028307 [Albula glossodonta]
MTVVLSCWEIDAVRELSGHIGTLVKQDEGDPRISSTLEPTLFQPPLPYTAPPFQKWQTGLSLGLCEPKSQ